MATPTPESSGSAAQQDSPAERPPAEHPLVVLFATWMAGSREAGMAMLQPDAPDVLPGHPPGAYKRPGLRQHEYKRPGARRLQGEPIAEPAADLFGRLRQVIRLFSARHRVHGFNLDESLGRFDGTTKLGMGHPLIRGDPRRLYVLQHEVQRKCLTTVLMNLSAAPRAAFILRVILGLSRDEVSAIFGTATGANTAYTRARQDLGEYLDYVCEHVDPENPCRCENRLASAVEHGFITWPERDDLAGDTPVTSSRRQEYEVIFAPLPAPK
ncbi:sigma-70 region 4 domain-containing protein [Nannocystis bainbridge]|uniref:Sigma-70 region 4 domain-containing protein n=1 Tax=Nannocystis bainbridge TaxID=2995303 RepID=A0ABT5E461_9BACT|nr:sigma-70 region 4 domain-containing protein [Nannocystis bainbridge]MDC0720659.1 sigma-70 region 4 domain-containing protein [Nannocystis bainbridge]